MVNRVGYEKMQEEKMFPQLLTWTHPNLVEIKHTENELQIFIEKPLEKKKRYMKNLPGIFFFFFFFVVGVPY